MTTPALDKASTALLFARVLDHARRSGKFSEVTPYEPKTAPVGALSCAVWVADLAHARSRSGLNITTARLELTVRLMTPMIRDKDEASTEPLMLDAVDYLMRAYSGDFLLDRPGGEQLAEVDLLGAHGLPLRAVGGYFTQDQRPFRAFTITLPLICDNLWEQQA